MASNTRVDTSGNRTTINTKGVNPLLMQNNNLREQILEKEKLKSTERGSLESKIEIEKNRLRREKPGFLDELNIIYALVTSTNVSLFAYCLFLAFFILIELFIVIAKFSDGDNDYYKILAYQERIREERIKVLEQIRVARLGEDDRIQASKNLLSNLP